MRCGCGHDEDKHVRSGLGSDVHGPCMRCMCKAFHEEEPETDLPDVTDADLEKATRDLLRAAADLGG